MDASKKTRPNMVITVDGPSGSGKSSISKKAAQDLGYNFLDTGAMYRSITWFCLQENLVAEDEIIQKLERDIFQLKITINPDEESVIVNDVDVTKIIREDVITSQVSKFSAFAGVRKYLVRLQRELVSRSNTGIVVEGRDIGSVVLPDAPCKIFITATDAIRAQRRARQTNTDSYEVLVSQRNRDKLDSTRTVSPLVVPKGAIILDNTNLDFDQSVAQFLEIVKAAKDE
ncbi:MAG: (d)CMP kinase [Actinomycetota bacterium]|nr:(d)CMP kinase [Actinomycetota bacterium]